MSDAYASALAIVSGHGSGGNGIKTLDDVMNSARSQVREFMGGLLVVLIVIVGLAVTAIAGYACWKFLNGHSEEFLLWKRRFIGSLVLLFMLMIVKTIFF